MAFVLVLFYPDIDHNMYLLISTDEEIQTLGESYSLYM